MDKNKDKLIQLIKKNFNLVSKENKHSLDLAADEIIGIDLKKIDKSLPRLAQLLNLNPNSKTDLQKIRDFITTVKSP